MADSMLIDGLIKFCDEKSKNIKLKAEPQVFIEIKQALEELKIYKQCNISKTNFSMGYNKAIDEFAEKLKETLNTYIEDTKDEGDYTYIKPFEISKRAVEEVVEQMKAGGENEVN